MTERLPAVSGSAPLDEIFAAIDDEISAASSDPSGALDLLDGRRLHRSIGGCLYSFRAETTVPFQPETPVEVVVADERVAGALVAADDFDVVVSLRGDVGAEVPSARLSTSPAFILERLRERLESVTLRPQLPSGGITGATWRPDDAFVGFEERAAIEGSKALSALDDDTLHPNPSQWRAMAAVAGSNLHFVWGPPGTGKTAALAQTVRMLHDQGERVLVLAHANVAVDVAMLRTADALSDTASLAAGRVIRVGDSHHPDAMQRRAISIEAAIERRAPELVRERQELEARRREITRELRDGRSAVDSDRLAAELRMVRERLKEIQAEYRGEASLALEQAQVIGATLSRLALSEDVWDWRPDAVLLDEASMASFPWVLLAATRAAKRLVIFGDFRQLPPVYLARTDAAHRWLGSDAFEVASVRERVDEGLEDPRVTLLDTQYRMTPLVGSVVSDLAYGGRLKTDSAAVERAAAATAAAPFEGDALVVVDTTAFSAGCGTEAKPGSFSRVNPVHVALALTLATQSHSEVALVTPYRAQARLLDAGLRDSGVGGSAATIHRFQGSERDVVVFDPVDARPVDGPSRLTGGDVDLALRLTNVALSRARGKAIVLADVGLIEDRFAPGSPLRRAVELCAERGKLVRPTAHDFRPGFVTWVADDTADVVLESEIGKAQSELLLGLPRDMTISPRLAHVVRDAVRRVSSSLVAAGPSLVQTLEDLPGELRLLPGPGVCLVVDHRVVVIGGRELGALARLESPLLAAALAGAVFGVAKRDGRRLSGKRASLERGSG